MFASGKCFYVLRSRKIRYAQAAEYGSYIVYIQPADAPLPEKRNETNHVLFSTRRIVIRIVPSGTPWKNKHILLSVGSTRSPCWSHSARLPRSCHVRRIPRIQTDLRLNPPEILVAYYMPRRARRVRKMPSLPTTKSITHPTQASERP